MSRIILRHRLTSALFGLVLALSALALPPSISAAPATTPATDQSVTGNGQNLPEVTVIGKMDARTLGRVINEFVQSHAKPSSLIGQVGRWREAVCPIVSGLQGTYGEYVARQITSTARNVGARTRAAGKKCDANIEVVFTSQPQALLDRIASKYHPLLGYYRASEVRQVTTFTHPVQAWYVTGTRSLDYQPPIQCFYKCGGVYPPDPSATPPYVPGLEVDSERGAGSGSINSGGQAGSHLNKGLRSEFIHVLIIADSNAVAKYPVQSIADYIALLALTRIASLDACSELPSILNLFAAGCAAPPVAITAADTAYLRALYATDLDQNLNIEEGDMHERMLQQISNQK